MFETMGKLFIDTPWVALLPAVFFLIVWFIRRDFVAGICGLAWITYSILETLNKYRITCSGECNIRVDLLLFYPILILISVGAIVSVALGLAVDSQKRGS